MKRWVVPFVGALCLTVGCDDGSTEASGTDGATGGDVDDQDDDDDAGGSDDDDGSGPGDSNSGDETTSPGTTTADGDSSGGDDETDSGEKLPPPPATGIQIVHVTADQGVRVPIAIGSTLVEGGQRNAPLYKNRAMMLRAFYDIDPGYEARDIYGVLYVEQPDGRISEYASFIEVRDKDCEGVTEIDCRYSTLPNTFFWRVEPEDVQPGMTYRIELFEAAPGHEDDVSDKIPNFPATGGSMVVGVEDSYMKMRVVLVPFDHDLNSSCPEPPDVNAPFGDETDRTVADFFAERLLSQNPVDEVEIMVHDVVPFYGSMRGAQLLGRLQELRFSEGAAPEYYYYGVARPCDAGPDFAGVAQLGGPTMGEAGQRVGWGVYYSNVGTTAETFVHEIGHEQGRAHVACNGEEGGPDPSYPDHPDGDLLSYGIDVFSPTSVKVHTPSTHDYMTYCSDTWVSEWAYNKVAPWIAEISSWELSDSSGGQRPLLVGTVRADGTEDWFVTRGHAPTHVSAEHSVQFRLQTGEDVEAAALWTRWEKSDDYNVIVPLPAAFETVSSLAWTQQGVRHEIDRIGVERLDFTAQ